MLPAMTNKQGGKNTIHINYCHHYHFITQLKIHMHITVRLARGKLCTLYASQAGPVYQ